MKISSRFVRDRAIWNGFFFVLLPSSTTFILSDVMVNLVILDEGASDLSDITGGSADPCANCVVTKHHGCHEAKLLSPVILENPL